MKRLLAGIAFAALVLTNLALLHRLGAMRAQVRPPVVRTVVMEKLVPAPAPELPEPQAPPVAAAPTTVVAEPPEQADVARVLATRALIQLASPRYEVDDLELSDCQRARLDEHQRVRDIARAAADELYDAAVRMELSAEQYEKWKAQPRLGFMISGDAIYRSGALTEFNP